MLSNPRSYYGPAPGPFPAAAPVTAIAPIFRILACGQLTFCASRSVWVAMCGTIKTGSVMMRRSYSYIRFGIFIVAATVCGVLWWLNPRHLIFGNTVLVPVAALIFWLDVLVKRWVGEAYAAPMVSAILFTVAAVLILYTLYTLTISIH